MDENILLSILPAEIWKTILNKINSSEDLKSCANSSPFFRELIKDQQVIYLFPEVIDLLASLNERKEFDYLQEIRRKSFEKQNGENLESRSSENEGSAEDEDETMEDSVPKYLEDNKASEDYQLRSDEDCDDGKRVYGSIDDDDDTSVGDSDNGSCRSEDGPDRHDCVSDKEEPKWGETMRNCRLVCSSWNEALEKCYQQRKFTGFPGYKEDDNPSSPFAVVDCFETWAKTYVTETDPKKFVKHFEQSHYIGSVTAPPKNPFPGRFLNMWFALDDDNWVNWEQKEEAELELHRDWKTLLEYFGKEIWYLELDFSDVVLDNDDFYLKIREWLELMPNLIYIYIMGNDLFDEDEMRVSQEVIESNPLPKFENLEGIRCDVPWNLVSELIRRNNHITILCPDPDLVLDEETSESLTNLNKFYTTLSDSDESSIRKFSAHWNFLNGLGLRFDDGEKTRFIKLTKVLPTDS